MHFTQCTMLDIADIVDTAKYPIDNPDKESSAYCQFVASVKSQFIHWGIVTLPGFLRTGAIEAITGELNSKSEKAWKTDTRHNIYLDDGDPKYQDKHIRNKTFSTKVCAKFSSPIKYSSLKLSI